MRFAIWLIGLFGVAVAIALFAGNNPGTITVFWPPYRVDLSLNLVLLLLAGAFVLVYLALRALSALFALPTEAQQWRLQQKEREIHAAFLDALSLLAAGRFLRARQAAGALLPQLRDLSAGTDAPPHAVRLASLTHLLLADSAHAVGDRPARDQHFSHAMRALGDGGPAAVKEAIQLQAVRWALDDQDSDEAFARLDRLPAGTRRRTLARRLRLAAARQGQDWADALKEARTLARHAALPNPAEGGLLRGLALELLAHAQDAVEVQRMHSELALTERALPDLAITAASRLRAFGGDPALARQWVVAAWEQMVAPDSGWSDQERARLVDVLDDPGLEPGAAPLEPAWLERIDAALAREPQEPLFQYLAGVAWLQRSDADAALPLLEQAAEGLRDFALRRNAWRALALLAEQRDDGDSAARYWRRAAKD